MNKVSAIVAAAVLAGHCLCVQPGWAAETPPETGGQEAPAPKADLTQGSLTAYDLPAVTTFGVADQAPTVPVQTRFGTQYNVVTEEQIRLQNSLDFYDALRNVPGVMKMPAPGIMFLPPRQNCCSSTRFSAICSR